MNMGMTGEIRMFSFNGMPKGWKSCDGQTILIRQDTDLFSILGITYGGNGQTTFALPDLRGRVPVYRKTDDDLGNAGGEERHALTVGEMPIHSHQAFCSNSPADSALPSNNLWADYSGKTPFSNQFNTTMANGSVSFAGEGKEHENMSPFLALNFGICLNGSFGNREGTIGEIIMYAGKYFPDHQTGWMPCEGQLLSIEENTALFSILAATFGGNGYSTFGLPDLRGLAAIQCGKGKGLSDRNLGQTGGSETVTLTTDQLAAHNHQASGSDAAATSNNPNTSVWAAGGQVRGGVPFYTSSGYAIEMNTGALSNAGGGRPHNNMPPYLDITFLICVKGRYPERG